jgi:hypothetical protein
MTTGAPNPTPARAPPRASPPVSPFTQNDYVEHYLSAIDKPTLQSVRTILADVKRQFQSPSLSAHLSLDGITPEITTTVTLATLTDNPFFAVLHRDRAYAIIHLPTGRIVSCHTQDVDSARAAYLSPPSEARHNSPTIDQHDDHFDDECKESPLPTPARFHRAPTPRYLPESPASPHASSSATMPHPDITYDFAAPRRLSRPVSARPAALAQHKEESSSVEPRSVPVMSRSQARVFTPHHCLPLDGVLPHPPTAFDAPPYHHSPPLWSQGVLDPDPNFAPNPAPWQPFHRGNDPRSSRPRTRTVSLGLWAPPPRSLAHLQRYPPGTRSLPLFLCAVVLFL